MFLREKGHAPRVAISRFNVNTASEQSKTPKREKLFWFDF